MYMRGLIPRNFAELVEAVPIDQIMASKGRDKNIDKSKHILLYASIQ